ncbi:uncharacterized protein LOC113311892 [Papaver somniferum]|uniref:uncharacterized protein LOC113311892 n=1 Tax=Papaver somniferum TaxID=3469 RepID=UPI000E6FB4A1|nr:uncharacterized protein LOC113311892 [Papaver somniferum]
MTAPPPAHLGHPNGHSSHESTDPTLLAILEIQRRQEADLRGLQQRNLALEFENYQLRNLRSRSRGSSSRGTSGHRGRIGKDVLMNGQAHSDPLVISLLIEELGVRRILVDSGSSAEVLFYDTFKRMELSDDILVPSTYRIYGFNGTVTIPKGEVTLRVSGGGGYLDTLTTFCVVDVASLYEAIIGRSWIARIKGVASAYHQRLRFPTYKGIAEVVGDSHAARQCMQVDAQINEERRARQRREKNKAKEAKAAEDLEKVISQAVMAYETQGSEPS